MILATEVWWGRWWYDTALLAFVVFFFLFEAMLLYRRSRLGWAMTAKCAALMFVFGFALTNPPAVLPTERFTIETVVVRLGLAIPLLWVIIELIIIRRQTVLRKYPVSDWLVGRNREVVNDT